MLLIFASPTIRTGETEELQPDGLLHQKSCSMERCGRSRKKPMIWYVHKSVLRCAVLFRGESRAIQDGSLRGNAVAHERVCDALPLPCDDESKVATANNASSNLQCICQRVRRQRKCSEHVVSVTRRMNLAGDDGFTSRARCAVQVAVEQEACIHTHAVNNARVRQRGERRPRCGAAWA